MDRVSTNTNTTGRPVFYAGQFLDQLASADLPGEYHILSEWDVLSTQLDAALRQASILVILDMFSFPFESITGELRAVPLLLVLPPKFDAEFLTTVFGTAAFEQLGFFDRVATGNGALWAELRSRYGWAECQGLALRSDSPEEAAAEILGLLESES